MSSRDIRESPRRLPGRWVGVKRALFRLAAAFVVFVGVLFLFPAGKAKPTWTSSDDTRVPDDFLFAMFPISSTVDLFDTPDGAPVGTLGRAVVNSQSEIKSDGWIRVNNGGTPASVRLSDLSYLPPPDSIVDYFAAFDAAYRARALNQSASARLDRRTDSAGITTATLHLRPDDDHVEHYVYRVATDNVQPISMTRSFGPADAMRTLGSILVASLAAAGVFVIARFARRRLR